MRSMARIFLIAFAIFGGITENASAERMASKGPICDSVDELKRFGELVNIGYSEDEALATVNREFDDPAKTAPPCVNELTTYLRGEKKGEKRIMNGIIEIYEALIFAVFREGEWQQIKPVEQFIPFFVPKASHGSGI